MASIKLFRGEFGHVSLLSAASNLVTHAHPEAHIVIWLDGQAGEITVSGQSVTPGPLCAVGVNSFEPHSHSFSDTDEPGLFLAFYIDPQWAGRRFGLKAGSKIFPRPTFSLDEWLRNCVIRAFERLEANDCDDAVAAYEVSRLVDRLVGAARPSVHDKTRSRTLSVTDFRVRRAIELMQANLSGRVNFDELARSVGLSRPHFFALFKEHTRLTPNVYWNTLRMEAALKAVKSSPDSLTEVACELGFTTQGNFTRFFRDHAGVSPTLYREAARPDVFQTH